MNPPDAHLKTPGLAVASLICGIGGFLTCLLTGIPAIITGHLALGKIKRNPGALKGSGMAMTGLILGYVTTIATLLIIPLAAIVTPVVFKSLERARLAQNISSASRVHVALQAYAMGHRGKYPPDLETLETSGLISSLEQVSFMRDKDTVVGWIYVAGLDDTSDYRAIILAAPDTIEQGGQVSRIVGHVDGSVEVIPEVDYQALMPARSPEPEARE